MYKYKKDNTKNNRSLTWVCSNSKQQQSNQFPMDTIKSCPIFFLFKKLNTQMTQNINMLLVHHILPNSADPRVMHSTQDPWLCPLLSGTNTFTADPLFHSGAALD